MNRWMGLALAPTLLASASLASAQVNVRAPFVRVQVGDPGVYVRAPFVNIGVPYGPTYYPPIYGPTIGPPVIVDVPRSSSVLQLPAPPTTTYSNPQVIQPQSQVIEPPVINPPTVQPLPPVGQPQSAPLEILPKPRATNEAPKIDPDALPPQPINPPLEIQPAPQPAVKVPTIEEFARSFQPKAGLYEVTLRNPATGEPVQVRFSLPDGTPRVNVFRREIEFRYSLRQFVRIEFDRDGAEVTSR